MPRLLPVGWRCGAGHEHRRPSGPADYFDLKQRRSGPDSHREGDGFHLEERTLVPLVSGDLRRRLGRNDEPVAGTEVSFECGSVVVPQLRVQRPIELEVSDGGAVAADRR